MLLRVDEKAREADFEEPLKSALPWDFDSTGEVAYSDTGYSDTV